MKKKFTVVVLFMFMILHHPQGIYASKNNATKITITVRSSDSSTFFSTLNIDGDFSFFGQLDKRQSFSQMIPDIPLAEITFSKGKKGNVKYLSDSSHQLFLLPDYQRIPLSDQEKSFIVKYVQMTREAHFGKDYPWKQVKKWFFRYKVAQIIDIETGKKFRVQRRAGNRHADVQPLTLRDTKVMKEIYDGKWSWKRRAILVQIDGYTIAASMHGMPHGAGAIRDNGFPGHFCIHFAGSKTHRRGNLDPGHQLMIAKASGQIPKILQDADGTRLIHLFMAAWNAQDWELMKLMMIKENQDDFFSWAKGVKGINIKGINERADIEKEKNDENLIEHLVMEVSEPVSLYTNDQREVRTTLTFLLARNITDRWRIVSVTNG
ncbi:hypothetical protein L1765_06980 [Microaerobacter geothermalis]|uniref:hypothetical protein n=1 Tax=Microaerobacter geothermalis TaxID=674972 RepID=UPI001F2E0CD7|nr:hypothetical protein [Microaerobacter geothermalis]MCF6093732.1 hypothetical protein [Microaerobacter geothermalis]